MISDEMNIKMVDNGFIVSYRGHDCLPKCEVYRTWAEVLDSATRYFNQG